MNEIFFDCETTGLDCSTGKHEIIEFCFARPTHPDAPPTFNAHPELPMAPALYDPYLKGLDIYWRRIKPSRPGCAEAEALKINGYNEHDWENAKPMSHWLPEIVKIIDGKRLCGHNIPFDYSFLVATLREHGVEVPKIYCLDTATLIWEHLLVPGIQKSPSLASTCKTLGIPNENAHGTLVDVLRTRAVFNKLLCANAWDRLLWRLKRWKMDRGYGKKEASEQKKTA